MKHITRTHTHTQTLDPRGIRNLIKYSWCNCLVFPSSALSSRRFSLVTRHGRTTTLEKRGKAMNMLRAFRTRTRWGTRVTKLFTLWVVAVVSCLGSFSFEFFFHPLEEGNRRDEIFREKMLPWERGWVRVWQLISGRLFGCWQPSKSWLFAHRITGLRKRSGVAL